MAAGDYTCSFECENIGKDGGDEKERKRGEGLRALLRLPRR